MLTIYWWQRKDHKREDSTGDATVYGTGYLFGYLSAHAHSQRISSYPLCWVNRQELCFPGIKTLSCERKLGILKRKNPESKVLGSSPTASYSLDWIRLSLYWAGFWFSTLAALEAVYCSIHGLTHSLNSSGGWELQAEWGLEEEGPKGQEADMCCNGVWRRGNA